MTDWPFGILNRRAYGVIYADPAWKFVGYNASGSGVPQRADEQHYSTMTVEDMASLPIAQLARNNCALCMWSTSSHTQQAFWLADQWGFKFSSKLFSWAKLNPKWAEVDDDGPGNPKLWHMGMGKGSRRNTEDCWLFTRAKPVRTLIKKDNGKIEPDFGVRELLISPVREHSRKPNEAYNRIERLFAGPYCELFARSNRPGWDSWDNETEKYDG